MSNIRVVPLGAGQDVGRSCILIDCNDKRIMLDCGMHMGFQDARRFPDFSYIVNEGPLTDHVDCVIISHFHLDHCGALPYMSEQVGYAGPIYMTNPTKAICPILLEDYRRIQVERKKEKDFFTSEMIKNCMRKVIGVSLHEVVKVSEDFYIKAYYAGHVLGAAMFHITIGDKTIVYTGDYNMTPDRHLGAAWIDKCQPDLLLTESTYATTIRDSKRCRERDFLTKVDECIHNGGKVLIPVFALGRAQELCILLETYWERMNIQVPIYFATGLIMKANNYYKLFISWTSEKIRKTFVKRNMFEFKHILPFDRSLIDKQFNGPMVVFATPGMLHSGLSLQLFKKWAPDEKNMVIMPGYCVAGTVGHKILNGMRKIEVEGGKEVEVKMSVQYMSFSAHADAKGIMQLIRQCQPKNVVLVHGEAEKMDFLKKKIEQEFEILCFMPANGETISIPCLPKFPVQVSKVLLRKSYSSFNPTNLQDKAQNVYGTLLINDNNLKMFTEEEISEKMELPHHDIRFTCSVSINNSSTLSQLINQLFSATKERFASDNVILSTDGVLSVSDSVLLEVNESDFNPHDKTVQISWSYTDEIIGNELLQVVKKKFSVK